MREWKHKSLEWIHKAREENYNETRHMTPQELLQLTRERTDDLLRALGLKIIPPDESLRTKGLGS